MMQAERDTTYDSQKAAYTVEQLLRFAARKGLIEDMDIPSSRNALLDVLGLNEPYTGPLPVVEEVDSPSELLDILLDYAYEKQLLQENTAAYRDLLDARIMGHLLARPSEIIRQFQDTVKEQGVQAATKRLYNLCIDSNYIRMDRISNNVYWLAATEYGDMEITINLSKPEKDPKEIALLRTIKQSRYPLCVLCKENVGYAGRLDHPARQNLRLIPLTLDGESWYFQFSPYVYYNEHCIVLHHDHVPMNTSDRTFRRLFDFVDQFPHYFIGSNAGLPIVGGSILSHDHFQGGKHHFPMEKAAIERRFRSETFPNVSVGIVKWPMSVIRIASKDRAEILSLACQLFDAWKSYNDPSAYIYAYTENADVRIPHNAVTPIARLNTSGEYELDLVLRNNMTNEEHPDGVFHPHKPLHHIKKENIGLIEVMGLAVLPGRLREELQGIERLLVGEDQWDGTIANQQAHTLSKHAAWIEELIGKYGTNWSSKEAFAALQLEVGSKFKQVLLDAGVFKRSVEGQAAFTRFLNSVGFS